MTRHPATCAILLLATSPLMAQSTLHGDVSNYREAAQREVDAKSHRDELAKCMVYLPNIKDPTLRNWCLAQSKRLP